MSFTLGNSTARNLLSSSRLSSMSSHLLNSRAFFPSYFPLSSLPPSLHLKRNLLGVFGNFGVFLKHGYELFLSFLPPFSISFLLSLLVVSLVFFKNLIRGRVSRMLEKRCKGAQKKEKREG